MTASSWVHLLETWREIDKRQYDVEKIPVDIGGLQCLTSPLKLMRR
jgi:hypothetical protein